ncbi:hypothetical protein [Paenibacillus abyssi]|uniref:Uncharacterized protein n=1 Tax=Paenibacillus abyssi TaxID=1340531 RepID=A0A917CGR9_9BACL|nr:hypothetical protein [Paenibacillus abyssi]GGF87989.1 hypothetical protein GCM10010916_01630 [Paenibacillus abyssi]
MIERIFGLGSGSTVTEAMMWRWAEAHPYLFTIIKVSDPYIIVAVAFIGYTVVKRITGRR